MSIIWTIAAILGIWIGVTGWFFALAHAKQLKDAGTKFGWIITYAIYPYLALGVVLDFLFNLTWGTVIFRELPREMLFTARVKRHVKAKSVTGLIWRERLNKIMPEHV